MTAVLCAESCLFTDHRVQMELFCMTVGTDPIHTTGVLVRRAVAGMHREATAWALRQTAANPQTKEGLALRAASAAGAGRQTQQHRPLDRPLTQPPGRRGKSLWLKVIIQLLLFVPTSYNSRALLYSGSRKGCTLHAQRPS